MSDLRLEGLNVAQFVIRTEEGIEAYKEDLLELFCHDREAAEKAFDKYVDPLGRFVMLGDIVEEAFKYPHIKAMQYEITELETHVIIAVAWIE